MKYFLFVVVGMLTLSLPTRASELDAAALAKSKWSLHYSIDRPGFKMPDLPPKPWRIQELASRSPEVMLDLWNDGTMYFYIPGMDDGDNPLKLSAAEIRKILQSACQLLQAQPAATPEPVEGKSFILTVALTVGDKSFRYERKPFPIDSALPPAVYNFIRTMQPYSPAWTKELK